MCKNKLDPLEIKIRAETERIETFNSQSQQDSFWGTVKVPFEAQHFVKNDYGDGMWYHNIAAEQKMKFSILTDEDASLRIEYIKLSLIGWIDYSIQSPRDQWDNLLDLAKTDGAIGDNGSFYLGRTAGGTTNFELVASENLQDRSPNMTYSVIFSFVDSVNGLIRYCKIDPLLKTSATQHRG